MSAEKERSAIRFMVELGEWELDWVISGLHMLHPSRKEWSRWRDLLQKLKQARGCEMSAEKLVGIERFCPPGMQIKLPGGAAFDRDQIVGMEAQGDPGAYLIIHFKSNTIRVMFHRNVDGGPPDVYGLAENIKTGQTTR